MNNDRTSGNYDKLNLVRIIKEWDTDLSKCKDNIIIIPDFGKTEIPNQLNRNVCIVTKPIRFNHLVNFDSFIESLMYFYNNEGQKSQSKYNFSVNIAQTIADKDTAIKIKNIVYRKIGVISSNIDNIESIENDRHSIYFLVYHKNKPIGTSKMILPNCSNLKYSLPLESKFHKEIQVQRNKGYRCAELASYAVLEEYQKSLAGSLLFKQALAYAKDSDITHFVVAANPNNPSILRRQGFVKFGNPIDDYGIVNAPAIPMICELDNIKDRLEQNNKKNVALFYFNNIRDIATR